MKRLFSWFVALSKRFSRRNLTLWLTEELRSISGSSLVLNVGSGGEIQKIVRIYSKNVTTIDIDDSRNPDIVMDACNLYFDSNAFDVVIMMEVLEHIVTPQIAVKEIYRVLKPGGRLILSTPFMLGIHDAPYDFYRYTRHGLEFLLQHFSEVSIKERNGYFHAISVLPIRLMMSKYKSDKIIGIAFLFLSYTFLPFILILDWLIKTKSVTTGYFCTAIKI